MCPSFFSSLLFFISSRILLVFKKPTMYLQGVLKNLENEKSFLFIFIEDVAAHKACGLSVTTL